MEQDVIVGIVTSKRQNRPNEQFKNPATFIQLGEAVTIIAQAPVSELPSDGSCAAFKVAGSRSGKMGKVAAWGWPSVDGKGSLNKKEGNISVRWVSHFSTTGDTVAGGVSE